MYDCMEHLNCETAQNIRPSLVDVFLGGFHSTVFHTIMHEKVPGYLELHRCYLYYSKWKNKKLYVGVCIVSEHTVDRLLKAFQNK